MLVLKMVNRHLAKLTRKYTATQKGDLRALAIDGVAASVIAQIYNNEIRIFGAFCTDGMSLKRHLEECTRSWLSSHAIHLPLLGGYEDFTDVEIRAETYRAAHEVLSGNWASISKPWQVRRDAMATHYA